MLESRRAEPKPKCSWYQDLNIHTCSVHLSTNKFWQRIFRILHVLYSGHSSDKKLTPSHFQQIILFSHRSNRFLAPLSSAFVAICILSAIKCHSKLFASIVSEIFFDIFRFAHLFAELNCEFTIISHISRRVKVSSRFQQYFVPSDSDNAINCTKILWLPSKSICISLCHPFTLFPLTLLSTVVFSALRTMHFPSPENWKKKRENQSIVRKIVIVLSGWKHFFFICFISVAQASHVLPTEREEKRHTHWKLYSEQSKQITP